MLKNNSYALVLDDPLNDRGQIKIAWLQNYSIKLAVRPKYLRPVSKIYIHSLKDFNDIALKCFWNKLRSDPVNHIFTIPLTNDVPWAPKHSSLGFMTMFAQLYDRWKIEDINNETNLCVLVADVFNNLHPETIELINMNDEHASLLARFRFAYQQFRLMHVRENPANKIRGFNQTTIDKYEALMFYAKTREIVHGTARLLSTTNGISFMRMFFAEMMQISLFIINSSMMHELLPSENIVIGVVTRWFQLNQHEIPFDLHVLCTHGLMFSEQNMERLCSYIHHQHLDPELMRELMYFVVHREKHRCSQPTMIDSRTSANNKIFREVAFAPWIKETILYFNRKFCPTPSITTLQTLAIPKFYIHHQTQCNRDMYPLIYKLDANPKAFVIAWPQTMCPYPAGTTTNKERTMRWVREQMYSKFVPVYWLIKPLLTPHVIHSSEGLVNAVLGFFCGTHPRVMTEVIKDMKAKSDHKQYLPRLANMYSTYFKIRDKGHHEALDIIKHEMKIKDIRDPKKQMLNLKFWDTFTLNVMRISQMMIQQSPLFSELETPNDMVVVETLMFYKGMEWFLNDPSYKLHVLIELPLNHSNFERADVARLCREWECTELMDYGIIQWIEHNYSDHSR